MMTLFGLHDQCPVILAEIIKWITSSARHARRVNVYSLARQYQMNIVDMRIILAPFVNAGLIYPVGAGKKYLNKIEIDNKLKLFWREWVLPALAPYSFGFDIKKMHKKTLLEIFGDNTLRPYCKGMTRKPKDQVVLCLFKKIFKSRETFVVYQNRCRESLTAPQREILRIIRQNIVDLDKAKELCDCDQEQFFEAIAILREKWLIRVVWQEEADAMKWKVMLSTYEQFVRYIPCHDDKTRSISDKSIYRMLDRYKDGNHRISSGKGSLRLWEYYFLTMEKEWSVAYGADSCFLKHFMEFWYTVFHKNSLKYENINALTSGLFQSNSHKTHVLVLTSSLKQYLKFAIEWGLLCRDDPGIMLTTLGGIYVKGMTSQPRMIWGRNKDQLTIILSGDQEWFAASWLEQIALKTDDGNYLIAPEILKASQITRRQVLFILGSVFPLTARQKERIATWVR